MWTFTRVGGPLYASLREGRLHLTKAGFDRYHDLERWVTYHLIEPLWEEMLREHPASDPGSRRRAIEG